MSSSQPTESLPIKLVGARVLVTNTAFNLIGQSGPMLVALFSIPILIKRIGTDRFGILNLVWVAISYLSLFDLGLSRAMTKMVAEKLGSDRQEDVPVIVWTCFMIVLIMGFLGMGVLSISSSWPVYHALKIPNELKSESLRAIRLIAMSIPIVISTSVLRGVLEAKQRFDLVNAIRLPFGVLMFGGPLLTIPFSESLVPITAVLVIGRALSWLAHFYACLYIMPALRHKFAFDRHVVKPLVSFGAWMTVNTIIGPLMLSMDRFLIGMLVSSAAVAYYATPYEVVTKVWVITGALGSVIFPAFANNFPREPSYTSLMFTRATRYVFMTIFPLTLLAETMAYSALFFWLGPEFAENSFRASQMLAVGVFLVGLGSIPHAFLQAIGRPDLPAKLNFIELPIYLLGFWWATNKYGIEGASAVWTMRALVDTWFLFLFAEKCLPVKTGTMRNLAYTLGAVLPIYAFGSLPFGIKIKAMFLGFVMVAFSFIVWRLLLEKDERILIKRYVSTSVAFVKTLSRSNST